MKLPKGHSYDLELFHFRTRSDRMGNFFDSLPPIVLCILCMDVYFTPTYFMVSVKAGGTGGTGGIPIAKSVKAGGNHSKSVKTGGKPEVTKICKNRR